MNQEVNILIGGIRVPPDASEAHILEQARKTLKRAGLDANTLSLRLYKKSVDARHRDAIRLVCTVLARSDEPIPDKQLTRLSALPDVRISPVERLEIARGNETMTQRPLVVGMGPAGLFCALLLAENGYSPILIDRGDCVSERVRAVDRFHDEGCLDTDSNIQFGAGGAGTFSDG